MAFFSHISKKESVTHLGTALLKKECVGHHETSQRQNFTTLKTTPSSKHRNIQELATVLLNLPLQT